MKFQRKKGKTSAWLFEREKNVFVFSSRLGLVDKIDTNGIEKILSREQRFVESVSLEVEIGDPFPEFEYFREEFRGLLCVIKLLTTHDQGQPISTDELDQTRTRIIQLSDEIEKCFDIDSRTYRDLVQPFADLIRILQIQLVNRDVNLPSFIREVASFLDDRLKIERKSQLKNSLIRYFIVSIFEQLPDTVDEEQVLDLIYTLKRIALPLSDLRVFSTFLDALNHNLYILMTRQRYYSKVIATQMLYIKETAFPWSIIKVLDENPSQIKEMDWKDFYYPLFRNAIDKAFEAIYIIIKFGYTRPVEEVQIYLDYNLPLMIDLLSEVGNTEYIESATDRIRPLREVLGEYLVYTSIYLFKCIQEELYPNTFFSKYAVPIANNCTNVDMFNDRPIAMLDRMFYEGDFSHRLGGFLSNIFEISSIHNAGAYSPLFYNPSMYWIVLSIYRKLSGEVEPFIPRKRDKSSSLPPPPGFSDTLKRVRVSDIAGFLPGTFEGDKIEAALLEYKSHVQGDQVIELPT